MAGGGAPGLWGTKLGEKLRAWMVANGRPLLWADKEDGPMLIDPVVAAQLPHFSHSSRITKKEITIFTELWLYSSLSN